MTQLEIFHEASFKVSRRDKATRMFYLERAVEEVLSNTISTPYLNCFILKVPCRRRRFCPRNGHVCEVSPHTNGFSTSYPWRAQAAHSLQDVSVRHTSTLSGERCPRVSSSGQSSPTANTCSTTGSSGRRHLLWLSRLPLQDGHLPMKLLPVGPPYRLLDDLLLVR